MAQCKECLHYGVCAKEGRLVQVDEHTWDEYNLLPNVEQFCTSYFTADVVPKSEEVERASASFKFALLEGLERGETLMAEHDRELARKIFEEIEKVIYKHSFIDSNRMKKRGRYLQ